MKRLLIVLWCLSCLTPLMCEQPLTIQLPPEMRKFTEIGGEQALYFLENDWAAFSTWMWEDRKAHGEAAAAEAARPLLVEIAGLKAERDTAAEIARKSATQMRIFKVAAVVLAVVVVGETAALLTR